MPDISGPREPEEHERLADQLEAEADKLARENARLEKQIEAVRTEWQRKQADPAQPGAIEPLDDPPDADRRDPGSST